MAQACDFSSFYGSHHLSDVTLVLKLAEDEAAAQAPPAKKARCTRSKAGSALDANAEEELPGHGVVLAGSSSYFAVRTLQLSPFQYLLMPCACQMSCIARAAS